jgi:hypothetical protein
MLAGTFSGRGLLRRRRTETVQVRGRVIVELKGPRKRVEHLCGGVLVTALLETDVVIGADAGEHRDLLAAKARYPPVAAGVGQLDVLGTHELAPGAEVLADRVLACHRTTIRPSGAAIVALPLPGSAEPLYSQAPCRTLVA